MPNAVPVACAMPRCPRAAVYRGRCDVHRQTTSERGYGAPHQDARARLERSIPSPCGYCGVTVQRGEAWVAAHVIDGDPSAGWVVAHGTCNERAKWTGRGDRSRRGGDDSQMTRAPLYRRPQYGITGVDRG
jgi:hypothetical protein